MSWLAVHQLTLHGSVIPLPLVRSLWCLHISRASHRAEFLFTHTLITRSGGSVLARGHTAGLNGRLNRCFVDGVTRELAMNLKKSISTLIHHLQRVTPL